jgi:GNAT superfamily N-acetyltransferase
MDGRATAAPPLTTRVRRATAADTEAVARFTRSTWDGWDYVADILPAWLAARDGIVLAAETDAEPGRPIAVARATLLSRTEGWMEGLRVDPDARGRGVAIALQLAQLTWIQAQGPTIVRYATGETNEASLHLGGKHRFTEAGRWRALRPETAGDSHAAGPVAAEGAESRDGRQRATLAALAAAGLVWRSRDPAPLWDRVRADATFSAGGGLYEWRAWAWQALDEERVALHTRRGELLFHGDGERWAAALLAAERVSGETRVAVLGGDAEPARRIIDAVTEAAGRRPIVRLPEGSPLLAGLAPAMTSDGWRLGDGALVLMARPLRDTAGRPLALPAEGSEHLTFLEEPRDLGLVPAD